MVNPYNLRNSHHKWNYKQINDIALPRIKRSRERRDKLYPIEVVERQGSRVTIYCVGYNDDNDEWQEFSEIVPLSIYKMQDSSLLMIQKKTAKGRFASNYNPLNWKK